MKPVTRLADVKAKHRGEPGWREGLEVLCLALDLEGNLSTFGRIAMRGCT